MKQSADNTVLPRKSPLIVLLLRVVPNTSATVRRTTPLLYTLFTVDFFTSAVARSIAYESPGGSCTHYYALWFTTYDMAFSIYSPSTAALKTRFLRRIMHTMAWCHLFTIQYPWPSYMAFCSFCLHAANAPCILLVDLLPCCIFKFYCSSLFHHKMVAYKP